MYGENTTKQVHSRVFNDCVAMYSTAELTASTTASACSRCNEVSSLRPVTSSSRPRSGNTTQPMTFWRRRRPMSQTVSLRTRSDRFLCETWYRQQRRKGKVKFFNTCYGAFGPELIPVYRQLVRRWLFKSSPAIGCHYFLPNLRSPSQPKNVTVFWPVPS